MQEAEVLVDAIAIAGAQVEDVERCIEMEGEFEVGARLMGMRGEDGDVEGVVLRFINDLLLLWREWFLRWFSHVDR